MKRHFIIFSRLMKVQSVNYFTDVINIVLGFVLTTLTMICWLAFRSRQGGFIADPFVLASAIGISSIRNSQYNLNSTLVDWRFKGLFKTFGQTPMPKWILLSSIFIFNWLINSLVFIILFSMAMLFPEQRKIVQYVNWWVFLVGFGLTVLLSNVIAIATTFLFKRTDYIFVIASISYFGPMYLLGLGIPWNISGNIPWLNYFLYLWPHRYTLAIMQSGWIWKLVPNLEFPIVGSFPIPGGAEPNSFLAIHGFGFNSQLWIPILASFGWIFIFAAIIFIAIYYKSAFGIRTQKIFFSNNKKHFDYIRQIQKTSSLTELNQVILQINQETRTNRLKEIKKIKSKQNKSNSSKLTSKKHGG